MNLRGNFLDGVRYALALMLLIATPPALIFWLLVHPFVKFWRRLGPGWSLLLLLLIMMLVGYGAFLVRERALAIDFGLEPALLFWAPLFLAASMVVGIRCRKHLKLAVLIGIPELSPNPKDRELLREGIYARIRHPRYLSALLGYVGMALFVNYLITYLLVALLYVGLHLVIRLEERELRERFGEAYLLYSQRVPRLFPRLRASE